MMFWTCYGKGSELDGSTKCSDNFKSRTNKCLGKYN